MTDQESSYKSSVAGYMKSESLSIVISHYIDTTLSIFPKERLFLAPLKNIYKLVCLKCVAISSSKNLQSYL